MKLTDLSDDNIRVDNRLLVLVEVVESESDDNTLEGSHRDEVEALADNNSAGSIRAVEGDTVADNYYAADTSVDIPVGNIRHRRYHC
jgi:hypothetical protein